MATHFADKLVLARWALAQFGVDDLERIADMLKAPEFEGWAEDGGTKYVQQLVTRLPRLNQQGRALSDDQLREWTAGSQRMCLPHP